MSVGATAARAKIGILFVAAAAATVAVGCAPVAPKANPPQTFNYSASAYGSYASGPAGLTSAATFPAGVGCTIKSGLVSTNNGAATTLPGTLGGIGAVQSRATSASTATTSTAGSSETVGATNLLGGIIRAEAVRVQSQTTHTPLGFHSAGGTTFTHLTIAGVDINAKVSPNAVIQLAGLGTVTLNEQSKTSTARNATQGTNAIHVRITTANNKQLPVGAHIIVGTATSGLAGQVGGLVGGYAFGTSVTGAAAGTGVNSGLTSPVYMPCTGTDGKLLTASQAGLNLPGVATTGVITDTGRGNVTKSAANVEMTSTIAGANLLGSIVTATAVKAQANASVAGKARKFNSTGSSLANLHVAGHTGNLDNLPANTALTIPGVGVLYVHRVLRTVNTIEVRMLDLVVTVGGNALPVGAHVQVAVARAAVYPNGSK